MAIYKHSAYDFDVDKKGKRYSYYDYKPEAGDRKSCGCGQNCSGHCAGESSKRPSFGSSFFDNSGFEMQEGSEFSFMDQESAELIWVKESCNITVSTTDTQIGASLQAALELAIALVLNVSIADAGQREAVSQELTQQLSMAQRNKQKIYIYNTKDAVVTTQDTDLAINIQLMLQVLIALMLLVDIL